MVRRAGLEMVADKRDSSDISRDRLIAKQLLEVLRVIGERPTRGEVPHREHGVRLAATEGGLQIDNGRSARVSRESASCPDEQVPQPFGEIGALEKCDGICVFGILPISLTASHIVQVGCELSRLEAAGGDIRVGLEHITPRR